MLLTKQEQDFIIKTKKYFDSLKSNSTVPTVDDLAREGIKKEAFLSLAAKINEMENDEEREQQEKRFNDLWYKFCAIQQQLLKSNKPQNLLFGNSKFTKKKQNPHIEIEHPTNVLAELKNGYNGFLNLGEDVEDAILEAGGAIKQGAKVAGAGAMKGAKVAGAGAMKGAKVAGAGAMKGAQLAGMGVAAIGGGVVVGATLAWDKVLLPFKDSIVNLTNSTIKKVENYIRVENLKNADVQLAYVKDNANSLLENALQNAVSAVKILYPEIETDVDIEAKAKSLIEYAKLEEAVADLDSINIDLLNQPEQLKQHLSTFSDQVKDVQKAVAIVTTACAEITNQVQQNLLGDATESQNNKWLSKLFVGYSSKHDYVQEIARFKKILENKPFQTWSEDSKDSYLKTVEGIRDLLEHGIEHTGLYHRKKLSELKKELEDAYEAGDIEKELNLVEPALEAIADLDVAEAYRNADLESVKRNLESINEHKDALDYSVNKMQKSVMGISDPKKGLARLSSKKLSSLSNSIATLMQDILTKTKEFITKSPSLVDKLLSCATSAISAISTGWDKFTQKFYKFIGVKKTKENPECIYQHKGFSPKLIKKLIEKKFMVQDMFDENSYVYPDPVKKRARYPYNIKIKLECIKPGSNDKKIIEVPIMEFYQHGLEMSSFPMALIPKNYNIPAREVAKFEQAQQQLVHIITHDPDALPGVRTSKNIILHGFDDDHFGKAIKGSALLVAKQDKLQWKECVFDSKLDKELKKPFDSVVPSFVPPSNPLRPPRG